MGCPIKWAHNGNHFLYSDRSVNSAISGSNRADKPRSVGKFCHNPFLILPFAHGRKIWDRAPPMSRFRVMGTVKPLGPTRKRSFENDIESIVSLTGIFVKIDSTSKLTI